MRVRTIAINSVVVFLMTGAAGAGLSPEYADWAEGPVRHLLTRDEAKQWKSVTTDAEAKAFVDLFWARRDPTPETSTNEWRDEFDRRVAAADENFSTSAIRGSLSDRGRVLILLGPPSQVGSRGAAGRAPGMTVAAPGSAWDGSVASARPEAGRQTWTYSQDRIPDFVRRKDLELLFVDDTGRNEWQLARTERFNPEQILMDVAAHTIVSPMLTEAPVFAPPAPARLTALQNPSLHEAYTRFRAEEEKPIGTAHLTWGVYVTPEGDLFEPVQIFVPGSAGIEPGRQLTLFGVVENAEGEIVEVLEEPATLIASGRDGFVDRSLRLEPGRYTATFGLADDGRPLAMSSTKMTIDALDPKETGISQLILSNNVYALPEAQRPTDPYAFGGLKVVPKGDLSFLRGDQLWYFFELRNPGISDQGTPLMRTKINIDGKTDAEKTVKWELPMRDAEIMTIKGVENHYGLGMAFPLESFEPGTYTIKIRVFDAVLGKTYDSERPFVVR